MTYYTKRAEPSKHTNTHTHLCVCVCACVRQCVRVGSFNKPTHTQHRTRSVPGFPADNLSYYDNLRVAIVIGRYYAPCDGLVL